MISMDDIETLSDNKCDELISELIKRLKVVSYAKGYKDGFNDGKKALSDRRLYAESVDKEPEKIKDVEHKECEYHLGQIITLGKNKKEYEIIGISKEPWIEFDDGSMHYGINIKPCDGSIRDAIYLNDAQIDLCSDVKSISMMHKIL